MLKYQKELVHFLKYMENSSDETSEEKRKKWKAEGKAEAVIELFRGY